MQRNARYLLNVFQVFTSAEFSADVLGPGGILPESDQRILRRTMIAMVQLGAMCNHLL